MTARNIVRSCFVIGICFLSLGFIQISAKGGNRPPTGKGNQVCADSCQGDICSFKEILNAPLGNATLSIDESCQLAIDNIGGSGLDGVVQYQLQSVYMKTTLATPNFSGSITGSSTDIRQVGIAGGEPDQEIMLTRMVNFDGSNIRHSIDCSIIQVAGYTIDIYNGNALVAHQNLGVDPPLLNYPKEDLLHMACGIWPNGDVYTVFKLGSPKRITLVTSTNQGPFTGDVVFVSAVSPQKIPTLQTAIENTFFNVGSMKIASLEAGALPGAGFPCGGDCSTDLQNGDQAVRNFLQNGIAAVMQCAGRGEPVCPGPCPEFPTLEESGLSPSCYGRLSCYVDGIALAAIDSSWGENRCPDATAGACELSRTEEADDLMQQVLKRYRLNQTNKIVGDVAACQDTLQTLGCPNEICDEVPGWAGEILGQ